MVRKVVLSLIAVLGAIAVSLGQHRQVAGTVTGADGSPIAGATIMVEGTTTGTTSGADGKFALAAPSDATLSVSFIGYETQRIPVAGKSHIAVVLEDDATSIDNVVVIGYGTGRKVGTVIGSVDQVKSDKLENRPTNNVMDALQGQVAGLQIFNSSGEVDATSTIRLHGMGSLSAGNEPLILLDGAPITTGTLMAMNQNDIESMSVLKDASATSIYGSRASNGVIYVTTKRGARGQEDVEVTLRAQYTMSNIIEPGMRSMNTEELLNTTAAAYIAYQMNGSYRDYTDPDKLEQIRNAFVNTFGIDETNNIDWKDVLMKKNAPAYQIDLGVSGGSKKTSYYFSGNYLEQQGNAPGSDFSRYTFRSNIETRATKWLKLGMNLGLGFQKSQTTDANAKYDSGDGSVDPTMPIFAMQLIPSYQPAYDEHGKPIEWLNNFFGEGALNPLVSDKYTKDRANRLQLNGSAFIEIAPVKGLTLKSMLSANAFDNRHTFTRNPDLPISAIATLGSGSVQEAFQRSYNWTWTNTAEYIFDIAADHHFNALAGQETIYGSGESYTVGTKGITNGDLLYLPSGTEIISLPSYSTGRYAYNSAFGRVDYDYAGRYFVDAMVRYDACSRFGANNRGAVFYAFGGMWKASNEAFLRDNAVVSDLSVKASYGTQGNSGIGNYAQYEVLAQSKNPYNGVSAWGLSSPGNPDLAWEKQSTLTVGVSVTLWNKLSLEASWYRRQTDDLLMPKPTPMSSGFSSITWNVGAMRNSGIDLALNYDIFRNKDWGVNFYANFNYNKNRLTKLWADDVKESAMGAGLYYIKDKSLYSWKMPEWRGVDPETGAPQWTAADGGVTSAFGEAVEVDLGKSLLAPYSGGFGVAVGWKGITLNADFAWTCGGWIQNNAAYFTGNPYYTLMMMNMREDVRDYWKGPGHHSKYPALSYDPQFDSHLLEDASFLRLKNIQLAYSLPQSLLRKSGFIKGVKVFVGARNLWTATGYTGLDPEVAGANYADLDIYPNSRQWTFGAELKF